MADRSAADLQSLIRDLLRAGFVLPPPLDGDPDRGFSAPRPAVERELERWRRTLHRASDRAVTDAIRTLQRAGQRELTLEAIEALLPEAAPAEDAGGWTRRECPEGLCDGDGRISLRLPIWAGPQPPTRLTWRETCCPCGNAPPGWREQTDPQGRVSGWASTRETLQAWAEGRAIWDHLKLAEGHPARQTLCGQIQLAEQLGVRVPSGIRARLEAA